MVTALLQTEHKLEDIAMTKASKKAKAKVTIATMAVLGMAIFGPAAHGAAVKGNDGIKRDRFLLLDDRTVERTKNAVRRSTFVGIIVLERHATLKHVITPIAPYNRLLRSVANFTYNNMPILATAPIHA